MKFSARRLLILFSVCLNIGFVGVAGYGAMVHKIPWHSRGHRGYLHARVLDEVALAPGKRGAVEEIIDGYMAEMGEIRSRARGKKLAMLALLGSDAPPDREAVRAHLKAITAMEVERENAKFRHLESIRDALEPDEARQFFRILSERISRRSGHFRGTPKK